MAPPAEPPAQAAGSGSSTKRQLPPTSGSSSSRGSSPFTPAAAASLAFLTPPDRRAHDGGALGTSQPNGKAAAVPGGGTEELQRRQQSAQGAFRQYRAIHSFVSCLAGSPLTQSALLWLEANSAHPPLPAAGEGDGISSSNGSGNNDDGGGDGLGPEASTGVADTALEWTLAQMLALFLRAGYTQASEEALLACLWVLESLANSRRSPATICLNSYVRHLALCSPTLARQMTLHWSDAFPRLRTAVVAAQMDVLKRLDWRVSSNFESEILPCHRCLTGRLRATMGFTRATPACMSPAATHVPQSVAVDLLAAARQSWAGGVRFLCVSLQQLAVQAKRQDLSPPPEHSQPPELRGVASVYVQTEPATKRRRTSP